ncbi:MAG: hypothetical protein GYB31_15485 [Bacteroidetes bacterium]|nr:hypothetical protein [Bacteroidota bacterium]
MKALNFNLLLLTVFCCLIIACQPIEPPGLPPLPDDTTEADSLLEVHLKSVREKDLETLTQTLPPADYPMQLILPDGTRMETAGAFLDMHREWFKDTTWTMETKVLFSDRKGDYTISVVESVYREPDRNGNPYFHKMYITYALKQFDENWLVVMDHASTQEKSE